MLCVVFVAAAIDTVCDLDVFIISARLGEKYINIWTRGAIAAQKKKIIKSFTTSRDGDHHRCHRSHVENESQLALRGVKT